MIICRFLGNIFFDLFKRLPFFVSDVFGDGSCLLADLPGHALGQIGVIIDGSFFVGDAMWGTDAGPNAIGLLVQDNKKRYRKTHELLHKIAGRVEVIPSHVMEEYA